MTEKINLEGIFEAKAFYNNCLYDLDNNQKQCVLDIMKEAIKQALELAAEKAMVESIFEHTIESKIKMSESRIKYLNKLKNE